jgi:Putative metallopeptidase
MGFSLVRAKPLSCALLTENEVRSKHCLWLPYALLFVLALGTKPLVAQAIPPDQQPVQERGADAPKRQAQSDAFEARIRELARALANQPRLKGLTAEERQKRVEFVTGNMMFVGAHELGHAIISEMDLPILGREEDAADVFAILAGLNVVKTDFSLRVLEHAARGWFLSARRDRKEGETLDYYGRHGLDEQRAYHIVCLMVGSDPVKFKAVADETKLPEIRRPSCGWDYDTATRSWRRVLMPYRRAPDQPKTQIEIIYGPAEGILGIYAQSFRDIRFLETLADHASDQYVWPAPFTMEMRTCGEPGARWTIPMRRLHICYELGLEFHELYLEHGTNRKRKKRV